MDKGSKGFTLVELMIVMVLVSVTLPFAITFLSGQRLYYANQDVSNLQETLKATSDIISRDLNNSGSGLSQITTCCASCSPKTLYNGFSFKLLDTSYSGTCTNPYTNNLFVIAGGTSESPQDIVYTFSADSSKFFLLSETSGEDNANIGAYRTNFTFKYKCFRTSDLFAVDDYVVVGDYDHGGIFKITAVNKTACSTSGTDVTITATDAISNQQYKFTTPVGGNTYFNFSYHAGVSYIALLKMSKYYPDNANGNVMIKYKPGADDATGNNPAVLTNNISKMAIVLGASTTNPPVQTVDTYRNTSDSDKTAMCTRSTTKDDPTRIMSIRLMLLGSATTVSDQSMLPEISAAGIDATGDDINFGRWGTLDADTLTVGAKYRLTARQVPVINNYGARFNPVRTYLSSSACANAQQ